ncbi:hypothetical protein [Enterococcus sp. DIV0840c]|uniref:hypothetical protein n=1 Tax=Enterococcus sp. DIV0840c TaxID=2774772 RepID=UPI003D2E0361
MSEYKNKSKIEQLRDWYEVVQIRKRRHQSIWYLGYFFLMVVVYSGMILSGIFIKSNTDVVSTPVGQLYTLNSRTYTLHEKTIDKENNRALFIITNPEEPLTDIYNQLDVTLEFINASQHKAQATVIQGDRGYYVILLENLPESYTAMRVAFELTINDVVSEGVILVNVKEEISEEILVPSEADVFAQSLEFMIEDRIEQVEKNRTVQEENQKTIEESEEKISILEESKAHMTDREIIETDGSIEQLKLAITNLEARNRTIDSEIEELEKQVANLRDRLNESGESQLKN